MPRGGVGRVGFISEAWRACAGPGSTPQQYQAFCPLYLSMGRALGSAPREWVGSEGAVDPSSSSLAVSLLWALPMASVIHDVQYEEAEGTWVGAQ